jgi:ComF family protein
LINFFNNIRDFFFPKICIVSNQKIKPGNSNDFINDDIFGQLEKLKPDDIIELREKVKSDYFNSFLAFKNENSVQMVIHFLKFKGFNKIGVFLGNYFGNQYVKIFSRIKEYDIICPVPLYSTKERERGYNQSEFICKGINDIININQVNDLVIRTRNTKSQTHLKYFERLSNVKNAFKINDKYKGSLADKKILLVDDVVTTGATINEVIKVLRNENVKEISALTIAAAR